MNMRGTRKGLRGCFVRCRVCRMYLELEEARKVGVLNDWGLFVCTKCGRDRPEFEGCKVVEENREGETTVVGDLSEDRVRERRDEKQDK